MNNKSSIKKTINLCVIIFSSLIAGAQNNFEGKLLFQMINYNKEYKEDAQVTWYIKNGKHRMDYTIGGKYSNSYSIIADNFSANIYSQKTVTPIPLNSHTEIGDFKIISEEKNIIFNSFNCTQYLLSVADGTVEIWISEQNAITPDIFPAFMQRGYLSLLLKLEPKGIPIKIIKNDQSGHLVFSQAITSIIPESISDSLFIIQ